jgi:hypothetical protein
MNLSDISVNQRLSSNESKSLSNYNNQYGGELATIAIVLPIIMISIYVSVAISAAYGIIRCVFFKNNTNSYMCIPAKSSKAFLTIILCIILLLLLLFSIVTGTNISFGIGSSSTKRLNQQQKNFNLNKSIQNKL